MPDLEDVYQKFGFVAEAAQLVETEMGTLLLWKEGMDADLIDKPNPELARTIHDKLNRHTLGQLIKKSKKLDEPIDKIESILIKTLKERNRLFHSFYRQHNFRRNSSDGCQIMLDDLENIHDTILDAYTKLLLLSGIDIEDMKNDELPTGHVKI